MPKLSLIKWTLPTTSACKVYWGSSSYLIKLCNLLITGWFFSPEKLRGIFSNSVKSTKYTLLLDLGKQEIAIKK